MTVIISDLMISDSLHLRSSCLAEHAGISYLLGDFCVLLFSCFMNHDFINMEIMCYVMMICFSFFFLFSGVQMIFVYNIFRHLK